MRKEICNEQFIKLRIFQIFILYFFYKSLKIE